MCLLLAAATGIIGACSGGGNGGGGGVSRTCGPSAVDTVTINGTATYDFIPVVNGALQYDDTSTEPIRGATIQLLDNSGDVFSSTTSDINGSYSFEAPTNRNMRVRVLAELRQESGASTWDISVTDNTNGDSLYTMQGSISCTGESDSTRDLHANSGWNGIDYANSRTAAPFAILDSAYLALQTLILPAPGNPQSISLPAMELRWSENNRAVSGNENNGEIGTSKYSNNVIYILGSENNDTDEYDRSVVIHEFMHYIEDAISRSDSRGGEHSLSDNKDMRLAFSEALANAYSGIAGNSSEYQDSVGASQQNGFSYSIETNVSSISGWYREYALTLFIFDLYDDTNESGDDIDLGWLPIYQTLTSNVYIDNDAQASIFSFTDTLRDFISLSEENDLDGTLADYQIFGRGQFGEGETNDGDTSIALPVYNELNVGSSITVCSNEDGGEFNGIGVRRFIRVEINLAATYRITATRTSSDGNQNTDPDFVVHFRDEELDIFVSGVINEETGTIALDPGTHIIELFDYDNTDENTPGGESCFGLSISQE